MLVLRKELINTASAISTVLTADCEDIQVKQFNGDITITATNWVTGVCGQARLLARDGENMSFSINSPDFIKALKNSESESVNFSFEGEKILFQLDDMTYKQKQTKSDNVGFFDFPLRRETKQRNVLPTTQVLEFLEVSTIAKLNSTSKRTLGSDSVLLELLENTNAMVIWSFDGDRLCKSELQLPHENEKKVQKMIRPEVLRAMKVLLKAIPKKSIISLSFTDESILLFFEDMVFVYPLAELNEEEKFSWTDIGTFIPEGAISGASINVKSAIKAIEKTKIIWSKTQGRCFFTPCIGKGIIVLAGDQEGRELETVISCIVAEGGTRTGINAEYILSFLKTLPADIEAVSIKLAGSEKPVYMYAESLFIKTVYIVSSLYIE